MWLNPQETVDLVTFTEEILDVKLHFFAVSSKFTKSESNHLYCLFYLNQVLYTVSLTYNVSSNFRTFTKTILQMGCYKLQVIIRPIKLFQSLTIFA